ncbi:MAG: peptidoglycan-associated lipoprotein Pal [Burkholderiaceae bacterium]|nr:peptidoglycan-associated lipoprotein Pal [Burkholderiaceae bacterium]
MKQLFSILALLVLLAGCSSGVKLDDVPVEDKGGTAVTPQASAGGQGQAQSQGTSAGQAGESAVRPLSVADAPKPGAGPANTALTVYFDYDSYVIKPEFQSVVDAHARFLKANAARRVVLEGHTDERGGREYNLALGQRRAEAVRRSLVLLGAADAQLEAVSFGKEKPADTGMTEAAFAKNRRVAIVYR